MSEKGIIILIGMISVAAVFACILLHARKRLSELRCDPPLDLVTTKPNWTFPKPWIWAGERIARSADVLPDDPPLALGDECIFISETGPVMTVVDANDTHVVTSWDDGYQEHKFPRVVVRRYKPDELVKPRKRVSA